MHKLFREHVFLTWWICEGDMVPDAVIVEDHTRHDNTAAHAWGVLQDPSGPVETPEAVA